MNVKVYEIDVATKNNYRHLGALRTLLENLL
jgi:hypothetical protein